MKPSLSLLLLLVAALFGVRTATAVDHKLIKEQTDAIMSTIMSPYCPGRLLRDCPSGQAFQLKEKIVSRLEAGESQTAIADDLIATFGESMRAVPKKEGFGLVAWIAPGAFLLFGALLILFWLRMRREQHTETNQGALNPEEQARVDSELLNSR